MPQDLIRDDRYLCPKCGKRNDWVPERQYRWVDYVVIIAALVTIGWQLKDLELYLNYYEVRNVDIVEKLDDYRFVLRFYDRTGKAQEMPTYFCKDYKPYLVPGCRLSSLRYEDTGECWSVKRMGLGYTYLTDSAGNDLDANGRVCFDSVKGTLEHPLG